MDLHHIPTIGSNRIYTFIILAEKRYNFSYLYPGKRNHIVITKFYIFLLNKNCPSTMDFYKKDCLRLLNLKYLLARFVSSDFEYINNIFQLLNFIKT